jgi:uncharacterized membrane protein YbhN (UPF0104 family)
MAGSSRPRLRTIATIAFYILLAGFLAYYLLSIDYGALADIRVDALSLTLAALTALAFRYWQTHIWVTVLRGLGARQARMSAELINVYSKSWLGRYIPGTAPWILGKIHFASQHGISKSKLAVGSLLEAGVQIVVLLTTSTLLLLFDSRLDVVPFGIKLLMGALALVGMIALVPPIFNWIVSLAFHLMRRPALAPENRASARTILTAAAQYTLGAVIAGSSLFFIAKSLVAQLDFDSFFFVVATSNLAGAVSMLAVFAPGGIGVREGIQLVLLGVVMPSAFAVVVVAFARLWGVLMDLGFFGIGQVIVRLSRFRERRRGSENGEGDQND